MILGRMLPTRYHAVPDQRLDLMLKKSYLLGWVSGMSFQSWRDLRQMVVASGLHHSQSNAGAAAKLYQNGLPDM